MENNYGIGIANRFSLFYDQDDVSDNFETVVSKKKKDKKEVQAPTGITTTTTAVPPKSAGAEKENKAQPKVSAPSAQSTANKAQEPRKDQRKGIKEQNNTRKDNESRQITQNGQSRPNNYAQKPGTGVGGGSNTLENREERNNRRNREMNGQQQLANGVDQQQSDKARNTNSLSSNNNNKNNNNNRRNFNGKRRDRQSGSDKTGVKAVDKRDGAGAHNWGTHKQDIEDMNKPVTDGEDTSGEKEGEEVVEEQPAAPEEPKEMTLDEYKAQRRAQMLQPQYNIRKAGEGEDGGKWADNMKKLDRKVDDLSALKKDDGKAKDSDGKKKQVLEIEFHFNDGRRGGLGRRGPAGGDRQGGDRKPQNRRRPPQPRENNGTDGGAGEGPQAPTSAAAAVASTSAPPADGQQRRPRRPRFQRGGPGNEQEGQHAPKVDDIRDFPSLG